MAGSGALLTAAVLGITVGSWDETFAILMATAITTLGFVAIMQFIGYLTDRAVLIGLAYLLIWEGIVTGAAGQVATTSIWRIGVSAYAGIVASLEGPALADLEDMLSGVIPGAWGALFKVLGVGVISVVLTGYLMRKRDLVS